MPQFPSDIGLLGEFLSSKGWKTTVHDEDVHMSAPASLAADVNRAAAEAGVALSALRPHTASLEEVFLRMTGEDFGDNGRPSSASPTRQKPEVQVMIAIAQQAPQLLMNLRPSSSAASS